MNVAHRPQLGQLPSLLRICVRQVHHSKRPKRPTTGFRGPEGHGENIWIFGHRRSDQIIYSLDQKLDGFHDLKQIPFNGKKLKPAKLRKDYWSPFARITFPAGQGSIGRSVFQKLRELKHLHEVAWDDEFRYKRPEEYTDADRKRIAEEEEKGVHGYRPVRSKHERGVALNAQKQNSIADMAAVLGGIGRGNKIAEADKLIEVTVSWANDQDKEYAESWTSNVSHELFDKPTYVSEQSKPEPEPVASPAVDAASQAEAGSKSEVVPKAEVTPNTEATSKTAQN